MKRERYVLFTLPDKPPSLTEFYGREFQETISPDEKRAIFGPSFQEMSRLFRRRSVKLPRGMLDRIIVLSEDDFVRFYQENLGFEDKPRGPAFTDSRSRYCFLNRDSLNERNESSDANGALRAIGVHEAAHSAEFIQFWLKPSQRLQDIPVNRLPTKRKGIYHEFFGPYMEGITVIQESFSERIAQKVLTSLDLPYLISGYDEGLDLVDALVKGLKSESLLFRANYTERGINELYSKLARKYDAHALEELAYAIMLENERYVEAAQREEEYPIYRHIKQVLLAAA